MAVYKSIMSGGGRNLHFALVDDKTDRVETIDLKNWLKANVRDNSSKDSKERVIKAILKGQKQFNKKVDFNMWAKKTKPSFEQTMDYFMKNGFVSNITKKGIKVYEGVESVNEDKNQIKGLVKKVKHEKLFYDVLSTLEKKYGNSQYKKWLDTSLRDFGERPSKYKTNADKEEKLFQLGK